MNELQFKLKKKINSIKFIIIGVIFCCIFYILEVLAHIFIFRPEHDHLLNPDLHGITMDVLVISLILILSIYIQYVIIKKKKIEQESRESEKKLRDAYELGLFYKDLFAHDMNNILQNIKMSAEYYFLFQNDPERLKDLDDGDIKEVIKKHIKRGANLISNVQKLSKLDETSIVAQPTEAFSILNKAIEFVNNRYQNRKVNVEIDAFCKEYFIKGNELLLDLAENILNNAIKYNDSEFVEILVKTCEIQKNDVTYFKVEFIDNGIGISDDRKANIFKRGQKKDITIRGMGIGLSLVKKIIEGYEGKIWIGNKIQGDYSKGSNFVVLLPKSTA
ncbi:MAG: sensor histidine kinase [Promethearchaeota archaeon]